MFRSSQRLVLLCVFFTLVSCRTLCHPRSSGVSPPNAENKKSGATSNSKQGQNGTSSTPAGQLPFLKGVNIAGLEFGMNTEGSLTGSGFVPPPIEQIAHFTNEKMNLFRFPVGWPYLQPEVGKPLNQSELDLLDKYVQEATKQNTYSIIDLHNFARRDGQFATADMMVNVWTQLAKHYADQPMVIFGLANEPHEVVLSTWIDVVQKVVTAVREAGANNYMLLPGNNWCHLDRFADDYKAGMGTIKNPDGSYNGLIFDLHQYFDNDQSGQSKECSDDHVNKLNEVVTLLQKDGRQALISEFGGGNTDSCKKIITNFVQAAYSHAPTISGVAIWAGGSFGPEYPLVVTIGEGNNWKDQININAMKSALGMS
ncbi:hypothetical protein CROQUDRAFT_468153 [Cronartium quercuum f. sp. fusiforme G11]|uniref:cellulase n=1 Tax=Cronartium quercuum f. sp. fusiforme G11 TaxID=708437 RepID=A0A9P6TCM4_9BASI|nr:hypothetical protein CROQUDRAFT_468153 [Cronartium quercuum f. sp. fusiforme G11]